MQQIERDDPNKEDQDGDGAELDEELTSLVDEAADSALGRELDELERQYDQERQSQR